MSTIEQKADAAIRLLHEIKLGVAQNGEGLYRPLTGDETCQTEDEAGHRHPDGSYTWHAISSIDLHVGWRVNQTGHPYRRKVTTAFSQQLLGDTLAKNKSLQAQLDRANEETSRAIKQLEGQRLENTRCAVNSDAWAQVYTALSKLPHHKAADRPGVCGRLHALATIGLVVEELKLKDADIEAKAKFIAQPQRELEQARFHFAAAQSCLAHNKELRDLASVMQSWRLLDVEEFIQEGDEVCRMGDGRWVPVLFVEGRTRGYFNAAAPVRRILTLAENVEGFRVLDRREVVKVGDDFLSPRLGIHLWRPVSDIGRTVNDTYTEFATVRRKIVRA